MSPLIGGAERNAVQLALKIAENNLRVVNGDLASNRVSVPDRLALCVVGGAQLNAEAFRISGSR